ncbi:MAG: hypothetical protein NC393_00535 [Clostridium sp.]|nr:hypothetical protein [Clostridium sp.]MCM1207300.1 hypothetical protein [Ruminococcus sp.]
MDELINALNEMKLYVDKYRTDLLEEIDGMLKIINDTKSNLGDDSLGISTVSMLLPLVQELRKTLDELTSLSKRIKIKSDELNKIIKMLQDEGEGDSQLPYGQKNIHKEIMFRR